MCVFISVHTHKRKRCTRLMKEENESVTEKKKTETKYKNLPFFGSPWKKTVSHNQSQNLVLNEKKGKIILVSTVTVFFLSPLSLSLFWSRFAPTLPRYNFVIYEKRLSFFSHIKYEEREENAVHIKSVFIHYGRVRVGTETTDFPRGAFEFVVDAGGGRCVFEQRRWCDFFFFFSTKFFFEITRFFLEKTGKLSNTKGTQNEVVRESTRVESKIESSVRRSVFYSGRIQIRVVSRVRRRRSFA